MDTKAIMVGVDATLFVDWWINGYDRVSGPALDPNVERLASSIKEHHAAGLSFQAMILIFALELCCVPSHELAAEAVGALAGTRSGAMLMDAFCLHKVAHLLKLN